MKRILLLCFIFFLYSFINFTNAQNWSKYNPTSGFDINSIAIPGPGVISIGGGWETNDSTQIMFQSSDYGITWYENAHDGLAPWNKSIAFSDHLNGYAVGNNGRIIKSDDAGMNWGWATSPIDRSLNKIVYVSNGTYYIAGGKKAHDSIQTIIKTEDFGHTWNVIYDNEGPWLKSIYFKDILNGFAVGDKGVILSTSDGGITFSPVASPIQRDFNGITFINADTGYIVGGISSGISRRTILQTTNGGNSWNIKIDALGGILKDISFADMQVGYTVGDNATVMKTIDGGLSWFHLIVDSNLAGNESFNAVKFYNRNFGCIGGKNGQLYVYLCPYPLMHTTLPTEISSSSARLNGSINAGGTLTNIKFEYGTTKAYGSEIYSMPASSSNNSIVNAYTLPTGLIPNTTYHYRIKGTVGNVTNYGEDMQFYTGFSEIPNFDFELWDSLSVSTPSFFDLFMGDVSQYSPGCEGNYAVRLANDSIENNIGVILIGSSNQGATFSGGVPFNSRPDSLAGCFNYDIDNGDTAIVVLILKKEGVFVANNIFEIYGTSSGNFKNLKFPIQYLSSYVPDSLIVGFTCTDFRYSENYTASSNIIIDKISFTGTALTIPNSNFEVWDNFNRYLLSSWDYHRKNSLVPSSYETVLQTNDAQSGNYAVILRNVISGSDSSSSELKTGSGWGPRFKVNARHETMTGYYKFIPENGDTMRVSLFMYKSGMSVSYSTFKQSDAIYDYTPFAFDINYFNDTIIPDSAQIEIRVTTFNKPHGNSVLYIDNLNFDGFLLGIKEPSLVKANNFEFNVFPNPFSENATVSFKTDEDEHVMIRLFDLSGKQISVLADGIYSSGSYKIDLSSSGLSKGFYICMFNVQNKIFSRKLIVY